MMPLALSQTGDTVVIKEIKGREDVRQHLVELGFITGDQVTVVSELAGNLILQVKDSRIALNRGTASHILVDPC
ncbi:MAG: FeoA family protein [Porcincola intestinalis]|jgi:ferrous iron transport protein A|uniref:Ferrous iron transport protein A n=3 Tax=Porcincola intestinalis TaxID=2606632 RepID=A0A6L5X7A2_9FIRM|nr:FeoA family protein [Porcincola intestinalis]MCI6239350.1 ferrous iron transport protein A [Lachnospiraceae bacterium]MCI6699256.1 ferrous iron transport protein A [Lachnospiraceae bacterium]MCI6767738.1 ferrous iron transport protein A [Lachnospiraceae bacterium]MCI7093578.1 ferrous iron transport protein A [Lachnospiraceae bacterium]MDD7060400.1 FeoA family protein [Porcincola intestinalis]